MNEKTHVREIFSSTQGEGIYVGVRQIFLRFPLCNLDCGYCDTPSKELPDYCRVEASPGSGNFNKIKNPVSAEEISKIISSLKTNDLHSVSLTGGEPLLYPGFIRELRNIVEIPFYLETNSTLPKNANEIRDCVDFTAADIKIDCPKFYENSIETIKILKDKNLFIKIVVLPDTGIGEVEKIASDLKSRGIGVPLVLQPVTPQGKVRNAPDNKKLMDIADSCAKHLTDVRIIPQVHKILGVL